jgi:hypothetical protein
MFIGRCGDAEMGRWLYFGGWLSGQIILGQRSGVG